jgi:hypothetical protein
VSLKDYAHHNEDAPAIWWAEEGRHPYEPDVDDFYDEDEPDECEACEEGDECTRHVQSDRAPDHEPERTDEDEEHEARTDRAVAWLVHLRQLQHDGLNFTDALAIANARADELEPDLSPSSPQRVDDR